MRSASVSALSHDNLNSITASVQKTQLKDEIDAWWESNGTNAISE